MSKLALAGLVGAGKFARLIRERPGALTVDLAVRADGHAGIQALRIDGQVSGTLKVSRSA